MRAIKTGVMERFLSLIITKLFAGPASPYLPPNASGDVKIGLLFGPRLNGFLRNPLLTGNAVRAGFRIKPTVSFAVLKTKLPRR
jgi:hypothetical protein